MRRPILALTALLILLVPCALAQEEEGLHRGIDTRDLQRREVEVAGGQNLWSYMIFLIAGLAAVYFVFRGNKRA